MEHLLQRLIPHSCSSQITPGRKSGSCRYNKSASFGTHESQSADISAQHGAHNGVLHVEI